MQLFQKTNAPIIETVNLHKIYRLGKTDVFALQGVDLKITETKIIGITGPSGAGKSTLLYIVGGLEAPTAGSVLCYGTPLENLSFKELAYYRRNIVGFIFQFHNLDPTLTVNENIQLPMIFNGISREKRLKRVKELLSEFNLQHLINRPVTTLSAGEQQRIGICVALANNPTLLLADEPTGELDSKNVELVKEMLKAVNEDFGTTILLVSHDKNVLDISHRIITLKDGKLLNT